MPKSKAKNWALIILVVFHLVGVVGILSPYSDFFAMLSPLNLLLTSGLLFWQQDEKEGKALRRFFIITIAIGFIAELIGVQTGFPFGEYTYGRALGPKLFGTPLVIGVNWFIVAMGARGVAEKLFRVRGFQIFGAALIMVAFDLLIEPVAIQIDFWTWAAGDIPIQNYFGWLGVGLVVQAIYFYWLPKSTNPLSTAVLLTQIVFFASLLLFL
jgi:putative membrane protein